MRTVDELLADIEGFDALGPEHREFVAGCARNRVIRAGDYVMREGEQANTFFVIRRGAVAVETHSPQHGPQVIETLYDGDLLGWSWLFPPYRSAFDVRAVNDAHMIEFDGECLRGKIEGDTVLGVQLYRIFAGVILQRLQAARMRLLDLYGPPVASR
jgi:CRP/FNR family transcriptional regulator, cyclic AMP receptor protein